MREESRREEEIRLKLLPSLSITFSFLEGQTFLTWWFQAGETT
jgi:hypothetical protein